MKPLLKSLFLMIAMVFASASQARVSATGAQLPSSPVSDPCLVSPEANKRIAQHYLRIWQTGALDELGEVIGPGYIGHAASGDRDLNGLRQRIAAFSLAYPAMQFSIEDQVAVGDRVVTRMIARGVSSESGAVVQLLGLNISRFQGDRIVEEWPVWERLSAPKPDK